MRNSNLHKCLFCGTAGATSELVFKKKGYYIFRCSLCSLRYVSPQPSTNELKAIYNADYFERGGKYCIGKVGVDPNRLNDSHKLLEISNIVPRGKLLDVGCATGGFLTVAQEHGYETFGVEFSKAAAAIAGKKKGLSVFEGTILQAEIPENTYDVVTMWDVIEHLQNPADNLFEIFRVLKPGGLLALSTGDIGSFWARMLGKRWQLLTPPQHLFFFSKKSLETVLQGAGFKIQKYIYPGKVITLEFLGFKMRKTFGPLMEPFRLVTRLPVIQNLKIKVNLRDIVTCLAIKENR